MKIQTAADAKRLAAEGKAVRHDKRSWRSMNNFLPEGEGEYLDEYLEPVQYLDEEEDITAAVGDLSPSRSNDSSFSKRPE